MHGLEESRGQTVPRLLAADRTPPLGGNVIRGNTDNNSNDGVEDIVISSPIIVINIIFMTITVVVIMMFAR